MDGSTFDTLVRALARAKSRRSILGGLVAGSLGTLAMRAPVVAGKKISICHATGSDSNPWRLIEISENAWTAHQKHGDGVFGGQDHCGACGNACDDHQSCDFGVCVSPECSPLCQESFCACQDDYLCVHGNCLELSSGGCRFTGSPPEESVEGLELCVCNVAQLDDCTDSLDCGIYQFCARLGSLQHCMIGCTPG